MLKIPRDTRSFAAFSAIAALVAVDILVVAAGRDSIAYPATATRMARTAVALAAPGVLLAVVAPWLQWRGRAIAAEVGAVALAAVAIASRGTGGLWLLPAVLLLAVAGSRQQASDDRLFWIPSARSDLVGAAALATLVGVVGRAATLDGSGDTLPERLAVAAAGLVLLGWPLVGLSLLPLRVRHRVLAVLAAGIVSLLVVRAPAGGESWLIPGVALVLAAAMTRPADDEVHVGPF